MLRVFAAAVWTLLVLVSAARAQAPVVVAQNSPKVVIAQGGEGFVWLALYVARGMKAYEAEGLDVEVVSLPGGARVLSALIGGSATVAATSLSQVIKANDKSIDMQAFVNILDDMTMPVVLSKAIIAEKQLDVHWPPETKIRALKGLRIGVTTPGSGTDLFIREMLKRRGIDPDTEAQLITFQGEALVAAMEHNQIDAYMYTPPSPETSVERGFGTVWLNPTLGEIPELQNFTYVTLFAPRKNIEDNPELFRKIARATVRAMQFAHEKPKEALDLIRPFFPHTDPSILEQSFDHTLPAVPATGRFHQAGVDLNLKFYGSKNIPFDVLVTNKFVR